MGCHVGNGKSGKFQISNVDNFGWNLERGMGYQVGNGKTTFKFQISNVDNFCWELGLKVYNGLPGGKWEGKSHEMFPIFAEKTPDTRKFSFSDIFSKQNKKQQLIRKYLTLMFPIFAQEIPDIQPIILTQLSFHTTNRGRIGIFPLHLIRSKGKHIWDKLEVKGLQFITFYPFNFL